MTRRPVTELSTPELVARFVELGLAQDAANTRGQIAKYNRLFELMMTVIDELKGRDGDQRRELLALFAHPNLNVRLRAAKATLAVDRAVARQQLEVIAASHHFPAAGDAGMCLWNLDHGVFKPT